MGRISISRLDGFLKSPCEPKPTLLRSEPLQLPLEKGRKLRWNEPSGTTHMFRLGGGDTVDGCQILSVYFETMGTHGLSCQSFVFLRALHLDQSLKENLSGRILYASGLLSVVRVCLFVFFGFGAGKRFQGKATLHVLEGSNVKEDTPGPSNPSRLAALKTSSLSGPGPSPILGKCILGGDLGTLCILCLCIFPGPPPLMSRGPGPFHTRDGTFCAKANITLEPEEVQHRGVGGELLRCREFVASRSYIWVARLLLRAPTIFGLLRETKRTTNNKIWISSLFEIAE